MMRITLVILATACALISVSSPLAVVEEDVFVSGLLAMPWDSLCISTQHMPCQVIRIDSAARRARLPIVDSTDSVVTVLSERARQRLESGLGRVVQRSGFNQRLAGPDTIDVSLALFGKATADSVHLIMSIALPSDSSGVAGHVELRRQGGVWHVLRRWLLEG